MVVFNDKAFDETKVIIIEMRQDMKKIRMELIDSQLLFWDYTTRQHGLNMIAEITKRINERENEKLKIKAE